ncbi:MAG: hypothetical protein KDE48_12710, partial [Anaerolineales bacterium]|nr:hypothetical protein [Anaerolineales bacterium]
WNVSKLVIKPDKSSLAKYKTPMSSNYIREIRVRILSGLSRLGNRQQICHQVNFENQPTGALVGAGHTTR